MLELKKKVGSILPGGTLGIQIHYEGALRNIYETFILLPGSFSYPMQFVLWVAQKIDLQA